MITICTTVAICDSYGAGFEFYDRNLPFNTVERFVRHPTHGLDAGCYTDDTCRTIANALAMLDGDLSKKNLARRYVEVFKRDPRKGYSHRYQEFLENIKDADEYLEKIIPNSEKSGACMSAAIMGLYPKFQEVISAATKQAIITHDTINGVDSAMAVACAAWYMRNNIDKKANLGKWLNDNFNVKFVFEGINWEPKWEWKVKVDAIECARAAISVVMSSNSMTEIMKNSVALSGDVDTVAAIAGGIGCFSNEIEQNIPQIFYDTLEINGKFGLEYLRKLDEQLDIAFALPQN